MRGNAAFTGLQFGDDFFLDDEVGAEFAERNVLKHDGEHDLPRRPHAN